MKFFRPTWYSKLSVIFALQQQATLNNLIDRYKSTGVPITCPAAKKGVEATHLFLIVSHDYNIAI